MAVSTFDPVAPNDAAANWAVARRFVDAFAPHAQATPDMTVALDKGHLLNATTLVEQTGEAAFAKRPLGVAASTSVPTPTRVICG